MPIGVVIPKDVDDVIQTVAACRRYGAPILSPDCGLSPDGQACNVAMSKYMNRVLEIGKNRVPTEINA